MGKGGVEIMISDVKLALMAVTLAASWSVIIVEGVKWFYVLLWGPG